MIYDHFLERPYAKLVLYDAVEVLTPLNIAWNSFTSNFIVLQEPVLQSKEMTKNTGFFTGSNDIIAYGQIITKSTDFTSLVTIENFSFNYDENEYVSTETTKNLFTPGPNLITCLISSESESSCIE